MTSKYNFVDYQKECETNIYFTIAVWLIMSQHQNSPNWRKTLRKKYTRICANGNWNFLIYEETSPLFLPCYRVCYMHLIFSFSYTWYLVKVICRCYCTVVVKFWQNHYFIKSLVVFRIYHFNSLVCSFWFYSISVFYFQGLIKRKKYSLT